MSLSREQLGEVLAGLVYLPGWEFSVHETPFQGDYIRIRGTVANSYDPEGEWVVLDIKSPLPPFRTAGEFRVWLRWRLEGIAVHEVHEWLRDRGSGKALFDPHRDGVDDPVVEQDWRAAGWGR